MASELQEDRTLRKRPAGPYRPAAGRCSFRANAVHQRIDGWRFPLESVVELLEAEIRPVAQDVLFARSGGFKRG